VEEIGDCATVYSLPVYAYSYPVTIVPAEHGEVVVEWNGAALSNGDRVIRNQTITVHTRPFGGFEDGKLFANGEAFGGGELSMDKAWSFEASFEAVHPEQTIVARGSCGAETRWALYESGELLIHGTGATQEWTQLSDVPWNSYRADIKTVTIGAHVTSIGKGILADCPQLTEMNVAADNAFYCTVDGVLFDKTGTQLIQYPAGRQGIYSLPAAVETIGAYAFYGNTGLSGLKMGAGVNTIGTNAFSGCTQLTVAIYSGNATQWEQVSVESGNELLSANLHIGEPVCLTVEGVDSAYPVGATVKPTAVLLHLSGGARVDVTTQAEVLCELDDPGQGWIQVRWADIETDVPVFVYEDSHAILQVNDAHNAILKLFGQQGGQAVVAFYRQEGQMLAAQLIAVQAGRSTTALTVPNADLTKAECRVILLDNEARPQSEVIKPQKN